MNKFYRILRYIRPFSGYATLNIISNIFATIFSLFSFVMLVPFLGLLFGKDELVSSVPDFSFHYDTLIQYLNYHISQIIIENGKTDALIFICIFLLISFFLRNLFRFTAMVLLAIIRGGAIKNIRNDLYKKILILPLSFYSKRKKGDVIARLTTDAQEVEVSILNYLEMIIRDPIQIIAYFTAMVMMSPQLTLFVVIILPIGGFIIGRIGKSLRKTSKIGQAKLAGMLAVIEETISGLRIIKAFNAINFTNKRFKGLNQSYTKLMIGLNIRRDLSSPLSEFMSSIVIVIVLWFGGKLVLDEHPSISAEVFITYIVIFSQIIPPIKTFATGFFNIQKGIASAERIFEIIDAEEVITEKPDAKHIKSFEKEIEYRNVDFKYVKDTVLKDINIKIPKGKIIALVGQSGGGKSTFVDLLPRFYDCVKGEILIDNIPLTDYRIKDVRGLMGMVSQESILFNDTIFNNIVFGMEGVTENDVIKAAKVANAHEFISKLEYGYYSNIGDRGSKLSGGQRQRLSIARAVLRNPPILILDEATSSLDTESERLVQDALAKVMSNRTSIVIAHRLSTIQFADEIVVIQNGEIAERGTHEKLLEQKGVYKKLYDLQTFE